MEDERSNVLKKKSTDVKECEQKNVRLIMNTWVKQGGLLRVR